MKGLFYIDGIDAFTRYGVMIEEGGYNGVLSYPSLKEPEQSNNWLEEDGIEVDLSDPKLNTKELDISFSAFDEYMLGDFIALLSDGAHCNTNHSSPGHPLHPAGKKTQNIPKAETFMREPIL